MRIKLSLLAPVVAALLLVPPVSVQAKKSSGHSTKKVAKGPKTVTTKSGLKYIDLRVGKGPVARAGQLVTVHYLGTLTNGKKFDASYDRGEPFPFNLGAGEVIKGWDEGVAGMRVGGKRKLIIPAKLGYGDRDMGTIPPNSTLIFQVELLKIG